MPVFFSNPRTTAVIENWPMGGRKRAICTFQVERDINRGYRVRRETTGKPLYTTFGGIAVIVDGSDGKTYILQYTKDFDCIRILTGGFMDATAQLNRTATVWPNGNDDKYYEELKSLIDHCRVEVQILGRTHFSNQAR